MSGLRTYRCFFIDAQSHFSSAAVIACANDEAAKLRAREILASKPACRGIEIWEFDRRVHSQLVDAARPPLRAVQ